MTTIDEVVARATTFAGKELEVTELSGGLTNRNHLVTADGERFVVRVPGERTELLAVDRANERHNAEAAATTGVSPRIVEYLDDVSVMILEFVDGETMSGERLRAQGMQARIADSLRRLHTGPRFLRDFDMFRTTDFYVGIVERHDVRTPEGFSDRTATVAEVERALTAHPNPIVPCNNDLMAENYIDDGRQLWIIDFEYSGNNDPCFELGDTAQECELNQEQRAALCEAYFGRSDPAQLARMELHAMMADVGWTLWAAIQAKISTIEFDFWGWAVERWDRAVAVMDGPRFQELCRTAARA